MNAVLYAALGLGLALVLLVAVVAHLDSVKWARRMDGAS